MKRTDIEKILKQGSVRQKIKLYLTDIALANVCENCLDIDLDGKEPKIKGTTLLRAEERDLLWRSIKLPKDVEYYEKLCKVNEAFLFFKERFNFELMRLKALFFMISTTQGETREREKAQDLVNELLDLYPDKLSRDKALKSAIAVYEGDGGMEYQEKSFPKYLYIDRSLFWMEIRKKTEMAIDSAECCKEYIVIFKRILEEELPLKPYKDWVREREKALINTIQAIRKATVLEDMPQDFPKIKLYQEIEIELTDEDKENFLKAGE